MRIALADDHALFRAGLRSTLAQAFGPTVELREGCDFAELAELLASDAQFDLVLCDLKMPGMDPASGVRDLVRLRPATPLVVISASEDPSDACSSIEQGAKGYILKSDSPAVLQSALQLVLAGAVYIPAAAVLSQHRILKRPPAVFCTEARNGSVARLSTRQRIIFELLVDGRPNKQIARELGIAEGTVKAQLRQIFRKLGVKNRTQAALFAAELLDRNHADAMAEPAVAANQGSPLPDPTLAQPRAVQPAGAADLKIVGSHG